MYSGLNAQKYTKHPELLDWTSPPISYIPNIPPQAMKMENRNSLLWEY